MRAVVYIFILMMVGNSVTAQTNFEALISQAKENSPEFKVVILQQNNLEYGLHIQQIQLKPSLSLTSNIPGFTRSINSITQPDGSLKFQTQSQAFSSLGINASQNISLTGGRLSLISGLNRIDLFDPTSSTSWSSNLFIVNYSQPLFQFNELKYLKSNINADKEFQEAKFEKQEREFKNKVANLILDYILVTKQEINILEQITQRKEIIIHTQNLVDAGKMLIEDVDLLKIELKRLQVQVSHMGYSIESLERQIKYHFGDSQIQDKIDSLKLEHWMRIIPTKDSLLGIIGKDPQRLQNLKSIEEAKQNIERQKQNSGISASFDISFGYNQRADNLDGIYRNPLDRQMGTLSLTVPILDGGNAKYRQLIAQNSYKQAVFEKEIYVQTSDIKIDNILNEFNRLNRDTELSIESLAVARKRAERYTTLFEIGKITIDQYLQAQSYFGELQLKLLSLQVSYWKLWYSYWQ